jgi:hypothetical protein
MEKSTKVFVGMDVHKESIDVTLAEVGGEVRRLGQIGGDRLTDTPRARSATRRGRGQENPCRTLLVRFTPAPQILDRSSSATHSSHAPRSLSGSGFPYSPTALRGQGPLVSVDKNNHINV